jgi:hypothetical protein
MNRLGGVTLTRALTLLGALIVVGGFALALLSTNTSNAYNTFSPLSPATRASDVVLSGGGPGELYSMNLNSAVGLASHGAAGWYDDTQVIQTSETVSTATMTAQTTGCGGCFPLQGAVSNLTSGPAGGAPGGTGGMLEFSSDVGITSPTPQATASAVVALAYTVGGYVAYQSTYPTSAYVVVRVPAAQYQGTLARIEAMGNVTSLVSNSNDVTVQYTDLNATLASLRTEQSALLSLLNRSTTVNSTLQIENTLQGVDQQINDVASQMLQAKTLVTYSTIDVTVSQKARTTVTPLSILLKAAPENGTAPFSVTFSAIVKGGTQPYVVNYDFGDGSADQGQILIHTFFSSGDYLVTVTATDQNGTVAITTAKIHVAAPQAQLGAADFLGNVANLFVNVVEGIVEVAVVVLPLAAVGAVVVIPLRRRSRPQKDAKQSQ